LREDAPVEREQGEFAIEEMFDRKTARGGHESFQMIRNE
jgi:hypothetical protein